LNVLELVDAINVLRLPRISTWTVVLGGTKHLTEAAHSPQESIQRFAVDLPYRDADVTAGVAITEAPFAVEEPCRPSKFFPRTSSLWSR
jgi:hypothetical protein